MYVEDAVEHTLEIYAVDGNFEQFTPTSYTFALPPKHPFTRPSHQSKSKKAKILPGAFPSISVTLVLDGSPHTVAINEEGTGLLTLPNPNTEDVYTDPSEHTAFLHDIQGGNFANPVLDTTANTMHVQDTIDETSLTFTELPSTDTVAMIGIRLTNKPLSDAEPTLLVNGEVITVEIGTDGTGSFTIPRPHLCVRFNLWL